MDVGRGLQVRIEDMGSLSFKRMESGRDGSLIDWRGQFTTARKYRRGCLFVILATILLVVIQIIFGWELCKIIPLTELGRTEQAGRIRLVGKGTEDIS